MSRDRFYLKAHEWQNFLNLTTLKGEKHRTIHSTVINPGDENYEAIKETYEKNQQRKKK